MPTLLEASLKTHLLFSPFSLVEALFRVFFPLRQGVSVHNTHVVNTVFPLFPVVPDKKVALLFRDLWRLHVYMVAGSTCPAGAAFVLFTARPE